MQPFKTKTRRLKFWFHLFSAYLSRYKYLIILSLLLVVAIVWGTSKLISTLSRSNLITIGYVGNYSLETVPTEVLSLATQSLITADASGRPIPSLASHWTVSDDGRDYLVFLKDNLIWHDDTPVEAKDISIAIKNVQINSLNNKTIEFKLPNPIASFPTALDKPVFKARTFYGTGKFRIVNIDSTGGTIKKIMLAPKEKGLPEVHIHFYQTEDQLINAIKIGEVNYAQVNNAKIFESWRNLDVKKTPDNTEIVTIFFNTQNNNLQSQELRQALTYAINRTNFDGISASGPISQTSWAYNPNLTKYEYNTGKAKELLQKSQTKNPRIILSVIPGLESVAKSVQKDWQDIGVETEIKPEKSLPKDFQAFLAIEKLPPDPDQYAMWHSTQSSTNITKLKDVKIDKLLEDARAAKTEDARRLLYFDFQRFLVEDNPAAFLYYPYKYEVRYKNVSSLLDKILK